MKSDRKLGNNNATLGNFEVFRYAIIGDTKMNWEVFWTILTAGFAIVLFAVMLIERLLARHQSISDKILRSILLDYLDYQDVRDCDEWRHLVYFDANCPNKEAMRDEASFYFSTARSKFIEVGKINDKYSFFHGLNLIAHSDLGEEHQRIRKIAEDFLDRGIAAQNSGRKE